MTQRACEHWVLHNGSDGENRVCWGQLPNQGYRGHQNIGGQLPNQGQGMTYPEGDGRGKGRWGEGQGGKGGTDGIAVMVWDITTILIFFNF